MGHDFCGLEEGVSASHSTADDDGEISSDQRASSRDRWRGEWKGRKRERGNMTRSAESPSRAERSLWRSQGTMPASSSGDHKGATKIIISCYDSWCLLLLFPP